MVAVPADTPVTTPKLFTVAAEALLLDQVPPVVALNKPVFEPTHIVVVPAIGDTVGIARIVTIALTLFTQFGLAIV
jgi:hypothetical protein